VCLLVKPIRDLDFFYCVRLIALFLPSCDLHRHVGHFTPEVMPRRAAQDFQRAFG
jgi:hypothetical protein